MRPFVDRSRVHPHCGVTQQAVEDEPDAGGVLPGIAVDDHRPLHRHRHQLEDRPVLGRGEKACRAIARGAIEHVGRNRLGARDAACVGRDYALFYSNILSQRSSVEKRFPAATLQPVGDLFRRGEHVGMRRLCAPMPAFHWRNCIGVYWIAGGDPSVGAAVEQRDLVCGRAEQLQFEGEIRGLLQRRGIVAGGNDDDGFPGIEYRSFHYRRELVSVWQEEFDRLAVDLARLTDCPEVDRQSPGNVAANLRQYLAAVALLEFGIGGQTVDVIAHVDDLHLPGMIVQPDDVD